ncbi:MAG: RdgB/HAM1 family non-canonical purine NTP pyrophosphatase [Clostridiales bacterium]|nr:RdgB/HAM1 family non-canonical purine NTP pyrophosphatase [Clostridiales bacterium]
MSKRIIFATSNEDKMKEIRMILADLDYQILSLKKAGIDVDIVEDGTSFEENAIIKAKTVMEISNEIVMADDSGLEIDAFDKKPGIYSSRFLGEDTPYDIKNNYILEKLKDVKWEDRTARFVCAIACVFPDGRIITKRGVMEGYIGYEIEGKNGFGYDPIFWLPKYNTTSAALTPEDKNKESHRGKALEAIKEELAKITT